VRWGWNGRLPCDTWIDIATDRMKSSSGCAILPTTQCKEIIMTRILAILVLVGALSPAVLAQETPALDSDHELSEPCEGREAGCERSDVIPHSFGSPTRDPDVAPEDLAQGPGGSEPMIRPVARPDIRTGPEPVPGE
jgi:hypothetical protein